MFSVFKRTVPMLFNHDESVITNQPLRSYLEFAQAILIIGSPIRRPITLKAAGLYYVRGLFNLILRYS